MDRRSFLRGLGLAVPASMGASEWLRRPMVDVDADVALAKAAVAVEEANWPSSFVYDADFRRLPAPIWL